MPHAERLFWVVTTQDLKLYHTTPTRTATGAAARYRASFKEGEAKSRSGPLPSPYQPESLLALPPAFAGVTRRATAARRSLAIQL